MPDLKSLFPKASNAFLKANEKVLGAIAGDIAAADKSFHPEPPRVTRRGVMNKTEREFAMILEARKRAGEILRYEFEGITLRFASVRYTPDFAVFHRAYIKLIEVKGPFLGGNRERAVERFRHAKTYWGDVFTFEMWQRQKGGQWSQLI